MVPSEFVVVNSVLLILLLEVGEEPIRVHSIVISIATSCPSTTALARQVTLNCLFCVVTTCMGDVSTIRNMSRGVTRERKAC